LAQLSRLSLTNFRNFRQADIELPSGVSVFHGTNAQGKTALLEAAYTLAVGRAFRAEREREVVNFEAARCGGAAYITGVAIDGEQTLTVVVGYQPTGPTPAGVDETAQAAVVPAVTKQIRVNRLPSTAAGLVGRIGATLFVVDDLNLVLGSPAHRRRYLDVLICQAHRTYLDALQRYQAALRNRNGLLRRQRESPVDPDEMDYWDSQLVHTGARIALDRAHALTRLAEYAEQHHRELAEPAYVLDLAYRPSVPPGETAEATEEEFRRLLRESTARERATRVTATGPHRDDFGVIIGGLDAGSFASRGEARTIALVLRLAEADYLAEARADDPIILLDDVFSEMDAHRRERVLRKTTGYRQTLITTTDVDTVRSVLGDDATYFRVFDNAVEREG
jgi:DNA replication and repair protein RecF